MPQYRTQGKIIADILATARDMNQDGQGVGITTLLRRGNVSYSRMTKLIVDLVAQYHPHQLQRRRGAHSSGRQFSRHTGKHHP